ncbi:MAG: hypothetical protein ACI4J1_13055 [Ruminiclostridium sp.]
MNLVFFIVMIILHYCKNVRLSSQWVMIITICLLSVDIWSISAMFSVQSFLANILGILASLAGLYAFVYQNVYPSDNWSFNRYYTEKAKKLIGGRRLTISGLCGTIAGVICSAIGIAMLSAIGISIFGMDKDALSAVTIATAGMNFVLGVLGAVVAMIIATFGLGAFLLGNIMLTNGLIRSHIALYAKSDRKAAVIVLSSVPLVNIVYSFFCLKESKGQLKAEELYAEELAKRRI